MILQFGLLRERFGAVRAEVGLESVTEFVVREMLNDYSRRTPVWVNV
jgi:hypothetical protein